MSGWIGNLLQTGERWMSKGYEIFIFPRVFSPGQLLFARRSFFSLDSPCLAKFEGFFSVWGVSPMSSFQWPGRARLSLSLSIARRCE